MKIILPPGWFSAPASQSQKLDCPSRQVLKYALDSPAAMAFDLSSRPAKLVSAIAGILPPFFFL
jgi:hypothetical protein